MHETYVPFRLLGPSEDASYTPCRTDPTNVADKREFIKISQAVGIGFVVMGAIGYVVKLSTGPSISLGGGCQEGGEKKGHSAKDEADVVDAPGLSYSVSRTPR